MYNNYYQPNQPAYSSTPSRIGLKGRPVSSIDEARASTIDFDGSVFYFPDLANKRIYTKQINMDGSCSMLMYELKPIPSVDSNVTNNFITREEFDATINQIKNLLAPPVVTEPQAKKPNEEYKF